jgi:hypothetical protein
MNNPYDKKKKPPTPSSIASKTGKAGPIPSPSSAASASSPPGHMGDSISLARQHKKAANYLNQYLREVDEHLPDDIDGVTNEHMEGKHLKNFWRILAIGSPARHLRPSRKHFLVVNPRKNILRRQKRY